jgi:hypothetical protein
MSDPAAPSPQTPWDDVSASIPIEAPAPVTPQGAPIAPTSSTDGYTIPLISLGVALIACCILIPLGDVNRRLAYQREKLTADLDHIDRQIAINDEFLHKINNDPTLAERLALRQMKVVPKGSAILNLKSDGKKDDISPFLLVSVPPPPPMKSYYPVGGKFASLCRDRKSRLYMMGTGMLLCAAGLVLGASSKD